MTFQEADALMGEIIAFLLDCGGVYEKETGRLQQIVLESIATGQYLIYRDEAGIISHWLCYWKIHPGDIDTIEQIKPADTRHGSVLYVLEHGNKEGMKGMVKAMKDLRARCQGQGMQGVVFNSKGRGIRKFLKKGA
jgi:hypothetical protein